MKKLSGYLLDRETGAGISGKTVSFKNLAGSPITTATTYAQSVSTSTDGDGQFEAWFELSPGPVNIVVDAIPGTEVKTRKHDEMAQMGYAWASDIPRLARGLREGIIDGYLSELAPSSPSGHTIRIATGAAVVNGAIFSIENGNYEVVGTPNTDPSVNPRLDLVTIRQYNETAPGQDAGRQDVIITLGNTSNVAPAVPVGATFKDFPLAIFSTAFGAGTKTLSADLRQKIWSDLTPAGVVSQFAGSTAPSGWLICDGSLISRSTYADLFSAIGTTYGAGDGSTTFAIPNFKGRVLAGLDAAQTEFDILGESGGAKTHTLAANESGVPAHNHGHTLDTSDSGNHSHVYNGHGEYVLVLTYIAGGSATQVVYQNPQIAAVTDAAGNHSHTITGTISNNAAAAAAQAHNNLQPYAVINHIIKY